MEKRLNNSKISVREPQTGIFLSDFSTMKVGGKAEYFFEVNKENDLFSVNNFAKKHKLNIFVVGGGSNVLFGDGLCKGLFLLNKIKGEIKIKESKSHFKVSAHSGENWDYLVDFLVKKKIFGLENLSGIPGTVGGGPVQNIGAYGIEISSFIKSIKYFDFKKNKFFKIKKEDCLFGYRDSVFKNKLKNCFISEVSFVFPKNNKVNISYKDILSYFGDKSPNQVEVRNAVLEIRSRKFPDLEKIGTAGSFFKNIVLTKNQAKVFLHRFPNTPFFEFGKKIKIPTGFILDKICNLRGFREGNVGLFKNQSLVLVNFGNASAKEIFSFKEKIKKIVFKKTGIKIEEEVVILK